MLLKTFVTATAVALLGVVGTSAYGATVGSSATSNVVFLVDESGSMGGDQEFLANTAVGALDQGLADAGVTNRSYAVVGFGGGGPGNSGRIVGGGFADAATTSSNLNDLEISGFAEDGWAAIDFAVNNLNFTQGAAINFILVTDEPRDDFSTVNTFNFADTLAALTSRNIVLNAVVDNPFSSPNSTSGNTIGLDSDGNAYVADGAGGFTTEAGGVVGNGDGATETQYVALARDTGGAAWNINLLRGGGDETVSFTEAFIDIKVQEIVDQLPPDDTPDLAPVPLPAAGWMLLAGIGALGFVRRRTRATA